MQYEYNYHIDDLPDDLILKGDIAVDTEAMGINIIEIGFALYNWQTNLVISI